MSYSEALRIAQDCLDPDRRRKIIAITSMPWLKTEVEKLLEKKKSATKVEIRTVEKVNFIKQELKDIATEELIEELITRAATNEKARQFAQQTINQFLQAFRHDLPNIIKNMRQVKSEVKKIQTGNELKRVLIVGLLNEQAKEIRDKYESIFNLSFWKDTNIKSLRQKAVNADEIILMSKFISHSSQDVVKAANKSITMCNGTVSNLSMVLDDYFQKAY